MAHRPCFSRSGLYGVAGEGVTEVSLGFGSVSAGQSRSGDSGDSGDTGDT